MWELGASDHGDTHVVPSSRIWKLITHLFCQNKKKITHTHTKVSILWCSVFFMLQLSHPYMTARKNIAFLKNCFNFYFYFILLYNTVLVLPYIDIALTRCTFVGKVMSLLFNMLSRLVITFLSRSKRLLISWVQSATAVILESRKIVFHCFHCFPIFLPWSDGTGCDNLHFLNVEF